MHQKKGFQSAYRHIRIMLGDIIKIEICFITPRSADLTKCTKTVLSLRFQLLYWSVMFNF